MTLLYGGLVTAAGGSTPGSVRIDGARITEVGDLAPQPGEEVVDCTGCYILPGGIETHTHLDLWCGPGLTTIDDFASGTRSALAGGTTTVIDFATQFHGESLAQGLEHWHRLADGRAVTDYAFHLAMTEWKPEFAEQMAQAVADGVTSFKLYMAYRGSMMVDDDQILQALQAAKGLGATIGFHCENGYLVSEMVAQLVAAGRTTCYWHPRSRPSVLEREAIARLGVLGELSGALNYVVHLSAGSSLEEIRAARGRGALMAAETCPQYLVLDESAYGAPDGDDHAARPFVMSPPLRPKAEQDGLWAGLASGDIQFVGTDHCSFTTAQMEPATAFNQVPNGGPGIELRLALLFSYGVAAGRLTPARFAAVTSENAAKYFGLYPRKGALLPGSESDIVVYDPSGQSRVTHAALHDATDHTPYEGLTLHGRVRDVFLRGRPAVRDGVLADDLPPGEYLRCGTPDPEVR